MKNKKLHYKIAFDGVKVSKDEQMRLWVELVLILEKLHESSNKNTKEKESHRTF